MVNNDIVIVTNKRLKTFGKTGVALGYDWGDIVSVELAGCGRTYIFKQENLRVLIPALRIGDQCVYGKSVFYVESFYRGGYGINKIKPNITNPTVTIGGASGTLWVPASMITRISEVDFVE